MMKVMMKDESTRNMIDTTEMFINYGGDLQTLFAGTYDGGDFCKGLIFGRSGSKLLLQVSDRMMQLPDEHNPALKPKQVEAHPRITNDFLAKDKATHDQTNPAQKQKYSKKGKN